MLQRVEKHIILGNKQIDYISFLSKNLYNYVNYLIRQKFFESNTLLNEYTLTSQLAKEKQVDYKVLPAQTSQQIIKLLFKNWKSFFKSIKAKKRNSSKFKSKPKLPKYKYKDGRNIIIFTNQNTRLKDGYIHFPEKCNIKPLKTMVSNLCQVRIIPKATCYIIEVVYKKEIKQHENLDENLYLSIDLGINNLITTSNNVGLRPLIINGKTIKSINQYYNKIKAKLQRFIGVRSSSNRISKLAFKRNNKINDYLHKSSRVLINYCLENNIKNIVIGYNSDWKQKVNIGKVNNQKFVNIPYLKLITQIEYKAEEFGIKTIRNEESYTSKIDHLALEPLSKQKKYLGKRIKRGLFKSSTGCLLNADVNGAIGILRKVIGDNFISDRGLVSNPFKIKVF